MTKPEERLSPAVAEVLTKYDLYAKAAGFSPYQVDHMRRCVRYFDQFLGGIENLTAVNADDFRRYLVALPNQLVWKGFNNEQPRLLSGTSINTYARAVKTFFSWMTEEGIIPDNPIAKVKIPKKPRTLPKIYSAQDLKTVIAAAETSLRDNAIFSLFIDSGIRLEELAGIKMGNIDISGGWVKVMGKGRKERVVPFQTDAGHCLSLYIDAERKNAGKEEFLFLTDDGSPLSKRGIQSLMVRLGKKAGIQERLSPHKLRHSFATMSSNYGANLEELRIIMGHTDISTTSGSYLNVQSADLKKAHDHFSPLAHLKRDAAPKPTIASDKNRQAVPLEANALPETALTSEDYVVKAQEPRQIETDRKEIHPKIGGVDVSSGSDALRTVLHQHLYAEHSQKLTGLVRFLIDDIKNKKVEPVTKSKESSMFSSLGAVYHCQKLQLWPFLQQHLDNEFKNPLLSRQINQVATTVYWAQILKIESNTGNLADTVLEKLVLISERGTFAGICRVCEGYFSQDSQKNKNHKD